MKELEDIRKKINIIDNEITNLIQQRMDLVLEVAAFKHKHGLPVLHPNREAEVINKVAQSVHKEDYIQPVKELFLEIMRISRSIQTKKLIPYNIVLIGFMGTGKSTIAKALASLLSMNYIDIDENIEKQQGKAISLIFQSEGEAFFRGLEKDMIKQLDGCRNTIISCGGGVILDKDNIQSLKNNGKIILLKAAAETIYDRLKEDRSRPLLKDNPLENIRRLLKEREDKYETSADIKIQVDNKNIDDICNEIITKLYSNEK